MAWFSDCLHLNYHVTLIHKKVTRHIVQFMICIDKGRAKKKEKKTTISWKTVTQGITRVVLLVILSKICLFFHENHGVKTTERKLYERIISSKTKLKSRHATNPCFVQGGWHNNNGFSIFWLCSFSQGRSVVSRQDTEDKCYRTVMICPSQLVKQWNGC